MTMKSNINWLALAVTAGLALMSAMSDAASAKADNSWRFQRISAFPTYLNLPATLSGRHETSAEIIAATDDQRFVLYTDSPSEGVGIVDLGDPRQPKPAGFFALDGEPTSLDVTLDSALIAVNTSESYARPGGYLAHWRISSQQEVSRCDLGGQPDSVAISPDKSFVAVAIENERDEDLNDGKLPQFPAGGLVLMPLKSGVPVCDEKRWVSLTGLAKIAPADPEPEFVAINAQNQIVVTLQENNHLVIVDGRSGHVVNHFSAGEVNLDHVDIKEEKALHFDGSLHQVRREPDAVKWLDDHRFVTANEGDYKGGSRGFTIFDTTGKVLYESGMDLEHRAALAGHYPEKRSENKGIEPEGLAVGTFGGQQYIFVLSERGSVVGVYRDTGAAPEFVQLLPSGISPESAVALAGRGLFVTANETDLGEEGGARAHVMVYEWRQGVAAYPQIQSVMHRGQPVGWGALSGLAADEQHPGRLYAVNDSFYKKQPAIFRIDARRRPALIEEMIPVTRDGKTAKGLDLEGITPDGNGGFWLASEGNRQKAVPHALYHVNAQGEILAQVDFPARLLENETRFGAEGLTKIGDVLWVAIQRPWKDDPKNTTKLLAYHLKEKRWQAVRYPLEAVENGWVGLSEIAAYGDSLYLIERDNQIGEQAVIKQITRVRLKDLNPGDLGTELPLVRKEVVRDLLPDLKSSGGYVGDKVEGLTFDITGQAFVVTDNDGVDDSSGETLFFSLGNFSTAQ
ncbi:esterase-like activity of phytase family protein [Photobacterium sp. R1]